MSPVRGFHHHFPHDGGMVTHDGPAEACARPDLGPLTERPAASAGADPEPLRDYLATIQQSERSRYHDEGEGWTCVPATEAANNMAGLWDEARAQGGPFLDVERLAEAIRNTYIAPSASRDMDAENIAAEYARLSVGASAPEGEGG